MMPDRHKHAHTCPITHAHRHTSSVCSIVVVVSLEDALLLGKVLGNEVDADVGSDSDVALCFVFVALCVLFGFVVSCPILFLDLPVVCILLLHLLLPLSLSLFE